MSTRADLEANREELTAEAHRILGEIAGTILNAARAGKAPSPSVLEKLNQRQEAIFSALAAVDKALLERVFEEKGALTRPELLRRMKELRFGAQSVKDFAEVFVEVMSLDGSHVRMKVSSPKEPLPEVISKNGN